jgi:hypothetical protein
MGISWSDEDRKNDMLRDTKAYMRKRGEPIPTNDTQKVPDYFDEGREAMRYFTIAYYDLNTEAKKRLYSQPFVIGARGKPFSYAERKKKNLLDPDNPFTTMKGESEDMILEWIMENKGKLAGAAAGAVGAARRGGMTQCCGACQLKGRGGMKHGGMMGCRRGIGRF